MGLFRKIGTLFETIDTEFSDDAQARVRIFCNCQLRGFDGCSPNAHPRMKTRGGGQSIQVDIILRLG